MKKLLMSVVAAVALATPALAADLRMVTKAPPPPPPSPWDIAFGASLASDYIFRGITQSAHNASVSAYYEPRYNVTKDLQLYAGIAGSSIAFPNRAAAEIDFYAGIRPTFDKLALDFGAIYYWYPGGQCFNGSLAPVFGTDCVANGYLPVNFNVIKADVSFFEVYAKGTFTVNDQLAFGGGVYYSNSVLNSGADGTYVFGNVKVTAPSNALPNGLGFTPLPRSATGSWEPPTPSTAPSPRMGVPRRSRPAFRTRATRPGTSASASPRACSRSTSATTIPT